MNRSKKILGGWPSNTRSLSKPEETGEGCSDDLVSAEKGDQTKKKRRSKEPGDRKGVDHGWRGTEQDKP